MQAIASIEPAAAIPCPVTGLIELMETSYAASPMSSFTTTVSMRSFSFVPLPWGLM